MEEFEFLYDDTEETKTRFVSFVGKENRYDLVIMMSGRFYGKHLIMHLQSNNFAIIGRDDLEEEGYLEEAYSLSEAEAEELHSFLHTIV
ncbi:DUF3055 domain-containing protein [Shimazuella kribbensis]|jgi:hypothetical protein|uniref:DUF3055 domain-containing protein n=1 Tax=Shimazuella kribbensis TaxID=139808 RepID=UPI00040CACCF|nr:DUF3055 domain-containing protein [Shimazuella kribbensis]